jgi:hypothetical protein
MTPGKLFTVMGLLSDVLDEREREREGESEEESDGDFVLSLLQEVGKKVKGGWVLREELVERERERERKEKEEEEEEEAGGEGLVGGGEEEEEEVDEGAPSGQAASLVHSSLVKLTQAAFTRLSTLSASLSGKSRYLALLENADLFRRSCCPGADPSHPPPPSSPFASFYTHSLSLTTTATSSFTVYTLSKHFAPLVSLFDNVAALLEQGVPRGEVQFHPATAKAVHGRV